MVYKAQGYCCLRYQSSRILEKWRKLVFGNCIPSMPRWRWETSTLWCPLETDSVENWCQVKYRYACIHTDIHTDITDMYVYRYMRSRRTNVQHFSLSHILSTLKIEATRFYQTSVLTRSTQRHIPEDCNLHSHRRENLKSYLRSRLVMGNNWKDTNTNFDKDAQILI
jgi:hypothetical protein